MGSRSYPGSELLLEINEENMTKLGLFLTYNDLISSLGNYVTLVDVLQDLDENEGCGTSENIIKKINQLEIQFFKMHGIPFHFFYLNGDNYESLEGVELDTPYMVLNNEHLWTRQPTRFKSLLNFHKIEINHASWSVYG